MLGPGARLVSCHLGAGCSLAAAVTGEQGSRDTSMGFSPLSGLVMATRSGDIDPSIVTFISHQLQLSPQQVLDALNKQSGFFGIAGTSDSRYDPKVVLVDLYFVILAILEIWRRSTWLETAWPSWQWRCSATTLLRRRPPSPCPWLDWTPLSSLEVSGKNLSLKGKKLQVNIASLSILKINNLTFLRLSFLLGSQY